MHPVTVTGPLDHDHVAVVKQAVDDGGGSELIVQVVGPCLPGDVALCYLESVPRLAPATDFRRLMASHSKEVRWDRFPNVHGCPDGKKWLEIQHMLGLAANTLEAYARGLDF